MDDILDIAECEVLADYGNGKAQAEGKKMVIKPTTISLSFMRYILAKTNRNKFFIYPERDSATTYNVEGAPDINGYQYKASTIREGYIYISFEVRNGKQSDFFKEFNVDITGDLTNIVSDLSEDVRTSTERSIGKYYSISNKDIIWIAYSEFQWSSKFVNDIRTNQQLREARMQKFDATQWVDNHNVADAFTVDNIEGYFPLEDWDTPPERIEENGEVYWTPGSISNSMELGKIQWWKEYYDNVEAIEDVPDERDEVFFCLNDALGCADELLVDLNQRWAEMESLIIAIQTGIDRNVALHEIIRLGKKPEEIIDATELKQREFMHKSLLLLYQTGFSSRENEDKFGDEMDRERMELLLGKSDRESKRDEIKEAKNNLVTFLKDDYYEDIHIELKELKGKTKLAAKLRYAVHISQLQFPINAKDYLFDLEEDNKKNQRIKDKGINYLKDKLDKKEGMLFEEVDAELSVSASSINNVILTWNTIKSGLDELVKKYPRYLTTKVESLNSIRILKNGVIVEDRCFDVITLENAIKNKPFLDNGKQMLNLTDELIEKANTFITPSGGLETIEQVTISQRFEASFQRNGKLYDFAQVLENSKLWNRFVVGVAAFNLGLVVRETFSDLGSKSKIDIVKGVMSIASGMAGVLETGRTYQILRIKLTTEISEEVVESLKVFPTRMCAIGVWLNAGNDAIDSGLNVYRGDYDAAAAQGAAAICGVIAGFGIWNSWNPAGWIALLVAGAAFGIWAAFLEDDSLEELVKCCQFRDARSNRFSGTIEQAVIYHVDNSQTMVKRGFRDWADYELLHVRVNDILFGGAITLRSTPDCINSRGIGPSVIKEYFKKEFYLHISFNMARMNVATIDCQVYLYPRGFKEGQECIQLTDKNGGGNLRILSQDDPTAEHFIAFFEIPAEHHHIPNKQWRTHAEVLVICRCVDSEHTFPIDVKGQMRYVAIRENLYEEVTISSQPDNPFNRQLNEKMRREAEDRRNKELFMIRVSGDQVKRGTRTELLSPSNW